MMFLVNGTFLRLGLWVNPTRKIELLSEAQVYQDNLILSGDHYVVKFNIIMDYTHLVNIPYGID